MNFPLKNVVRFLPLIGILALILAIYLPSVNFEFTNLDDDEYVVRNGDIRRLDFESVKHWFSREYVLNYIPVTIASYAIDYRFTRLDPSGYRRTNIVMHCLNTALIYFLLLRMIGSFPVAAVSTFIFALHPVQIESVVWIAERKNLLSTLLMLAAFFCFQRGRLWLTLFSFALAVFSKPSVVVLPFIFLLYEYSFGKPFNGKRRFGLYAGAFSLAAFSAIVTLTWHISTEIYFRGGSFWTNSWVMVTVLFRYFSHLFYPHNLRTFYTTPLFASAWESPVLFSLIGAGLLFLLFIRCWRKNAKLAFWLGWFFIFLAPVSNIFTPISTLMNDRYLYIPIIGISVFCISGLQIILTKWLSPRVASTLRWIACFFGILFLISLTWFAQVRISEWSRNDTLWGNDQNNSRFPDPRFYYNSAVTYLLQGDIHKSIEHLDKVLKFPFAYEKSILMQAQNYLMLEKPEKAYHYLKLAQSEKPTQLRFLYQDLMGQYHEQKGDLVEAEKFYRQSIKDKPAVPTYQHLAEFLMGQGRDEEAVSVLHDGLTVDPDSRGILSRLCAHYLSIQDYEHAYPFYQQLFDLYPEDPMVLQISKQLKKFQDNS